MFGRGKFQNGVIIEPTQPFDPTDSEKLAKFRNDVWYVVIFVLFLSQVCDAKACLLYRPFVEQANAFAPTHSRIFKEVGVQQLMSDRRYLTYCD